MVIQNKSILQQFKGTVLTVLTLIILTFQKCQIVISYYRLKGIITGEGKIRFNKTKN